MSKVTIINESGEKVQLYYERRITDVSSTINTKPVSVLPGKAKTVRVDGSQRVLICADRDE